MLPRAACRAHQWTDVLRPFPARLVCRAPDRHAADTNQLEPAFDEHARLVRHVEAFESDKIHMGSSQRSQRALRFLLRIELVAPRCHQELAGAAEEQT